MKEIYEIVKTFMSFKENDKFDTEVVIGIITTGDNNKYGWSCSHLAYLTASRSCGYPCYDNIEEAKQELFTHMRCPEKKNPNWKSTV